MDIWQWLLTICGSLVVLDILLGMVAYRWLRKHPELLAQEQEGRVAVPPGFETDIRRAEQLDAQGERDPRAIVPLIQLYEQILERLQPDKAPLFYASIQNNLGTAYSGLPTGDPATNLEQAIRWYEALMALQHPNTAPLVYAATQNNLGTAYRGLPTGDRTANLEQAIRYYQEALRFRTPEAAPLEYAMTQNNLGVAYRELHNLG